MHEISSVSLRILPSLKKYDPCSLLTDVNQVQNKKSYIANKHKNIYGLLKCKPHTPVNRILYFRATCCHHLHIFHPEDGGRRFLCHIGTNPLDHTTYLKMLISAHTAIRNSYHTSANTSV